MKPRAETRVEKVVLIVTDDSKGLDRLGMTVGLAMNDDFGAVGMTANGS